jgi:hypothetical protein
MAKIDWSKPVLPQMQQIDETEGIGEVAKILSEATPEQLAKFEEETNALLERVANKIISNIVIVDVSDPKFGRLN